MLFRSTEAALRQQWGAAYDERLAAANRMIAENTTEQNKPAILARIGNDPVVADFLATIAKKNFSEDTAPGHQETSTALTPGEAKLKMNELVAERAAQPNLRGDNPSKYTRLNQEIERLATLAAAGQG